MRLLAAVMALGILWPSAASAFDHRPFDKILRAHVKQGRVDYASIKSLASKQLQAYLKAVAAARVGRLNRADQLAFYLNAYNAIVIQQVVEHYPIQSVMKVPGFFKRYKHRIAGKLLSLDELEHKLIRPTFKEPRVHFALVCAARSCPPLRAAAFSGRSLESVLERQARSFLNSWQGVRLQRGKLRVSQLFNWFAEDFKAAAGSVGKYLARYNSKHAAALASADKLAFIPYNWQLNGL